MNDNKTTASIVSLKIKNFLSISDVEIKPGQVNQVVGGNNAGKTTVLKALQFAARGSSDASLVKNGTDAAEVILELSDETVIRRRLSAEGRQSIDVKREGFKAPSPQTYLDALFDQSSFNPLELLNPVNRTEAILKSIDIKLTPEFLADELKVKVDELPPLDYGVHGLKLLDQAYQYFYKRRAEANKVALEKKNRVDTYTKDLPPDEPAPSLDRQQLTDLMSKGLLEIAGNEAELNAILKTHEASKSAQERLNKYCQAIDQLDKQIAEATAALDILKARRVDGLKYVTDAQKEVPEKLQSDEAVRNKIFSLKTEVEKNRAALKDIDRHEAIAKQRNMVDQMRKEYTDANAFADQLDKIVFKLSKSLPTKVMTSAEMPVPGLEYKEGAFYVDGSAVDNLSSSASLKLAVSVARKLAKKNRLICLDGAEMMDEETYKVLRSEIDGDGFTYFLTKVGEPFSAPGDKVISMQKGMMQ